VAWYQKQTDTSRNFTFAAGGGTVAGLRKSEIQTIRINEAEKMYKKLILTLVSALALSLTGAAMAKDDLPDVTEDGLMRIDSKHVDAVYWLEGATLAQYNKVMIMDCQVAFRKNWQRDYNRDAGPSTSRKVKSEDMERIKSALAAEFNSVFTKELDEAGYEVVDEGGDDVLILRPAIVNLDVTAPDLQSASRDRTYVTSAGQMTLYMDLFDSTTGAKIGAVVDAQRSRDTGRMSYSNRITNQQEAGKILRKWSGLLADALSEAHKSGD
jgi:hypothetical protein